MFEFFVFAFVTAITPGPNNSMLMASGIRFGRKKSLPHFCGIWLGFSFLFFIGGYLLTFLPDTIFQYLQYFGYIVITYIAYKIATTNSSSEKTQGLEKPFTFIQASLFQWVNPKAWVLAVGATVTYTVISDSYVFQVLTIASLFMIFGSPCTLLWLWFGASLKTILLKPSYVRIFNISMATLLIGSLIPVFLEIYQQLSV